MEAALLVVRERFTIFYSVACSLGATPVMELMIAAGKAVPNLQLEHGLAVERVYTGSFMTSLDMAGLFMVLTALG